MCRGGTWLGFERAIARTEDEHTTIVPATRLDEDHKLIAAISNRSSKSKPYLVRNPFYYHPRMWVGNVFGRVCLSVCLSVQTTTFEPLYIGTSFLVGIHLCNINWISLVRKILLKIWSSGSNGTPFELFWWTLRELVLFWITMSSCVDLWQLSHKGIVALCLRVSWGLSQSMYAPVHFGF